MWTTAEMADLTVEEREVLARCKLSLEREQKLKEEARARFKTSTEREQLLKEVRGRRDWRSVLEIVPIIAIFGTIYLCSDDQNLKQMVAFFFMMILLLQLKDNSNDRRLDALLELLDFDRKSRDDSNNSKTEKAG
jgi:hypothetical protein